MYRERPTGEPSSLRVWMAGCTPLVAYFLTAALVAVLVLLVRRYLGWVDDVRLFRGPRPFSADDETALLTVCAIGPAILVDSLRSRARLVSDGRVWRLVGPRGAVVVRREEEVAGRLKLAMDDETASVRVRPPRASLRLFLPLVGLGVAAAMLTLRRLALWDHPLVLFPATLLGWAGWLGAATLIAHTRFEWATQHLAAGYDATIPLDETAAPSFPGATAAEPTPRERLLGRLALGGIVLGVGVLFALVWSDEWSPAVTTLLDAFIGLLALAVGALAWASWFLPLARSMRAGTALRLRGQRLALRVDGAWRAVRSHEVVGPRVHFDADGISVWCTAPLEPEPRGDDADTAAIQRVRELGAALDALRARHAKFARATGKPAPERPAPSASAAAEVPASWPARDQATTERAAETEAEAEVEVADEAVPRAAPRRRS